MPARTISLVWASLIWATSACSQPEPNRYRGQIEGVSISVPSEYATVPVLYDGESDWTPPFKPKSERTFADPILRIAYLTRLSRPSVPQVVDYDARVGLGQRHPDWIMVSAEHDSFSKSGNSLYQPSPHGIFFYKKLLASPSHVAELYGLQAWSANRNSKDYQSAFDTEYVNRTLETDIMCSFQHTAASPSEAYSSCVMRFSDRPTHTRVEFTIDRQNLERWQALRKSALDILHSFVVQL